MVSDTLKHFLATAFEGKKVEKIKLGVIDTNIGNAINEKLGIKCVCNDTVLELERGVRYHFSHYFPDIAPNMLHSAEIGLGHSYSRAKVKFNVNKVDNMIIQAISLLDQLDKDVNTFSMRLKEWYSWHFPELKEIVKDNLLYAKVVNCIQQRPHCEDKREEINKIVLDESVTTQIINASKSSMGQDISEIDLLNVSSFTKRVINLSEYRENLIDYLHSKLVQIAPNLSTLVGDTVAARLISHAGSLTNLSKCPASTIQILGAEKALFRALKTRGNTPKYGIIFHSSFIGRASAKDKGRISRFLANKCAIATRLDNFMEVSTNLYGEEMKKQVESRLNFFETGTAPEKNIDAMSKVSEELKLHPPAEQTQQHSEEKEKSKKKKHHKKEKKENGGDDEEKENEKSKKRKHGDSEGGEGEKKHKHHKKDKSS